MPRSPAFQKLIAEARAALNCYLPLRNVIQHRDGSITLVTRDGEHKYTPPKPKSRSRKA